MPREVFVAGQILTAAEMNVVSDQTVMSFAGTAARGSAIPSPTEGMVTYLEDVNGLTVYDGSAWVPAASGATLGSGTILQVVQAEKTDTQVTSSVASGAIQDVTGLTATITPRSTSSKLLVMYDLNFLFSGNNNRANVILYRDSTAVGVGDVAGNRTRVTGGYGPSSNTDSVISISKGMVLDSPNTTSAVAYKIAAQNPHTTSATLYVNRSVDDGDSTRHPRSASRIIVMEVAG